MLQLMKLNEDWDQVYRSATLSLQHRLEALELENTAIKQLNSRLLLKVEHQQVNMQMMLQAFTKPQDGCIDICPQKSAYSMGELQNCRRSSAGLW